MSISRIFAAFALATTIATGLLAETHCPGNVASLPFRIVNRHQIVVPVSINHTGPYSFLLDTGTQITIVDSSLAAALHLTTEGQAAVAGVGFNEGASFAQLDTLEAGTNSVDRPKVLVYDLARMQSGDLHVRGFLGEDFLQRFDVLIDNAHQLLCLDATGAMRAGVKGSHVPLLSAEQPADGAALPASLIVAARLTDGMRPVRLKLDSGANVPFLYNSSEYLATGIYRGATYHGAAANGRQQTFSALPPQNVKLGATELERVPFLSAAEVRKDAPTAPFEGLLPLGLFRRVFINHQDRFAVLDSW